MSSLLHILEELINYGSIYEVLTPDVDRSTQCSQIELRFAYCLHKYRTKRM